MSAMKLSKKQVASALLALGVAACGGNAVSDDGASSSAGDEGSGGGAGTVEDDNDTSRGNVSIPETDFPFDETHGVLGGSVEGVLGNGWDFCTPKSSGLEGRPQNSGTAAHGESYLRFDSDAECKFCSLDGNDSQVFFLLEEPLGLSRQGLWFDVRADDSSLDAQGELTFVSAGFVCETQAILAQADLADLALNGDWGKRCIVIHPTEAVSNLGVYVSGDRFAFSFDARRATLR